MDDRERMNDRKGSMMIAKVNSQFPKQNLFDVLPYLSQSTFVDILRSAFKQHPFGFVMREMSLTVLKCWILREKNHRISQCPQVDSKYQIARE